MYRKKILGIIFSDIHGDEVSELTEYRNMASIPYGGRYRLIDFALSNLVNVGIPEVAIITKSNYSSLMEHLGSGRDWDLARKKGGLHILPPMSEGKSAYHSKLDALEGIMRLISNAPAEHIILSDSNLVCNIDFSEFINYHMSNDADMTLMYHNCNSHDGSNVSLEFDEKFTLKGVNHNPSLGETCKKYLNIMIVKKSMLLDEIKKAILSGELDFEKAIIVNQLDSYKIIGYRYDGYLKEINNLVEYYNANMDILSPNIMKEVFNPERLVYTRVHDMAPATYGLNSSIKNSLVADGSIIDGEVENSIIFRDVKIAKGAKVKNCILMKGTVVGADAQISYVIADKNVHIGDNRMIMGFNTYPIFIKKNSNV